MKNLYYIICPIIIAINSQSLALRELFQLVHPRPLPRLQLAHRVGQLIVITVALDIQAFAAAIVRAAGPGLIARRARRDVRRRYCALGIVVPVRISGRHYRLDSIVRIFLRELKIS